MGNHFIDRSIIGYHETFKLPFVPQNFAKQEWIARGRNTVDFVKGGHEGSDSCIHTRFEWWQVNISQCLLGNIHCMIIPARLRRSVGGIMLRTSNEGIGVS